MSTRIPFSQETLSSFKLSVTNAAKIIHELFWYELSMSIYDHAEPADTKSISSLICLEPFKPQKMKMYNQVAACLGYNNYKELEAVAAATQKTDVNAIFLHQHEDLVDSISAVFTQFIINQYSASVDSKINDHFLLAAYHIPRIVVSAIIFNVEADDGQGFCVYHRGNISATIDSEKFSLTDSDKLIAQVGMEYQSVLPAICLCMSPTKDHQHPLNKYDAAFKDGDMGGLTGIKSLLMHYRCTIGKCESIVITPSKMDKTITLKVEDGDKHRLFQKYGGSIALSNILESMDSITGGLSISVLRKSILGKINKADFIKQF